MDLTRAGSRPAFHIAKSLQELPAYVQFILDNHLEEFILMQWNLSEEIEAPIMRYFSHLSEAERLAISIGPTKEFWTALAGGQTEAHVKKTLEKWKNNQMPLITKDQVVSEDITKGNYIRKVTLTHFLSDYTSDPKLHAILAAEIDYYLRMVIQETFRVYIDVQNEKIEAVNRSLMTYEEQLLEAQTIANMGSFEWNLKLSVMTSHTPQLLKILECDDLPSFDEFINFIHPEDRDLFRGSLTDAIRYEKQYEFEYRYEKDDKSKVLWTKGIVKTDSEGVTFLRGTVSDVTERHQVLQKLREKDELNKQSQAITHVGNWVWTVATGQIYWSDELYRIYGLEPQSEEISFERFMSLLHPDERDKHLKRTDEVLRTGGSSEYHMRIIASDGQTKVLQCKSNVTQNGNGSALYMTGTCQDITTEYKFQLRLKEGTKFAESLIDSSSDTITAFDRELRLISINKMAAERFSLVRDEALGKHLFEIFPQVNRAEITDNMSRVLTGETIRYKSKSIISDGQFEVSLIPLLNASSEIYGILSVAHDITGIEEVNLKINELGFTIEQQNKTLKKNEEQYQKMIAEVQDYAIILLDMDGTICNWNIGVEKIKGYTAEEIIGKNFRLFYSEEDLLGQLPERLIGEATSQGRATHEGWRVRKDGTKFWGSIVITAIHDDGVVTGFSKVTRDLSERKIAEEALQQKNILLESANEILTQKNKELKAFTHVASHDLQEPLRKIRMFANLILDRSFESTEEKKLELLQRIIGATNNMQTFIEDMLVYSKINDTSPKVEQVDLYSVLESVLSLAEDDGIVVKADKLPQITGIRFQIYQLFQNLISNSVKYRSPNRQLNVIVKYQRVEGTALTHQNANPLKSYHLIFFEDNGIGFDNEYADKIFEPFQRLHTKSLYSGSGVGLAICKTIMESHHGFIYAQGNLGKGSTFYLAFPCDPASHV